MRPYPAPTVHGVTVALRRPLLRGPRSAVAAAHPLAVAAGVEVAAAGGSAVDAAVAAGAALAVVAPEACGLGGDALLLVDAPGQAPVAYVGAAAAPRRPILPITASGPASAGVPGAVAAWCAAHARFGTLALGDVLAPAARLAAHGFPVSAQLAAALGRREAMLAAGAAGWRVRSAREGERLRQPELATVLEAIRADGAAGLGGGWVAEAIAAATGAQGVSAEDLAAYGVDAEPPVAGATSRARLWVTPPPSQAALALLALSALEGAPPPGTVAGEHAAVEALKAAFERRPALAASGDAGALVGRPLPPVPARASDLRGPTAADHTAAVATADADGIVVSMLVSVFHEFGSGVLVPEAGLILNNRLAGLLDAGHDPALAPPAAVRPAHTLSPMLVEIDGRRLAIATPGADGQVQTLVQLVRLLAEAGAGLPEALHAPRWRAVRGRLLVEASFDPAIRDGLAALGHDVDTRPDGHMLFGAAAIAGRDPAGGVLAASDPRRETWAAAR
jgi:gamma-glutamyltranspeptidase / glutathione hydrolase